jgi:uncharacterized damage-inducible protein DinB
MPDTTDLRYPIGKWVPQPYAEKTKDSLMTDIRFLPRQLEYAIINLDEAQLRTPYREGGWNLRQVVHHVADSHMNAYIRFKWGLTEDRPTIKPYDEARWAELPDTEQVPINVSLTLLHALHTRLYELLKHISEDDWNRSIVHPQHGKEFTLWDLLGLYAWHGRHHTAHITGLRERMGW